MNHVIAIAGPVGSGKTSLARALAERLQDASVLCFDHYEDITKKTGDELVLWIKNGADFNHFNFPGLASALAKLKHGESVIDPLTKEQIEPHKYIVFEMPFGKAAAHIASYIDLLLWIDIPLDVALARKLREHTAMFLEQHSSDMHHKGLAWLHGYMDSYVTFVHDILQVQHKKVRPGADLLLDGTSEPEAVLQSAALFVIAKLP